MEACAFAKILYCGLTTQYIVFDYLTLIAYRKQLCYQSADFSFPLLGQK
jgi:hypothetical protein